MQTALFVSGCRQMELLKAKEGVSADLGGTVHQLESKQRRYEKDLQLIRVELAEKVAQLSMLLA